MTSNAQKMTLEERIVQTLKDDTLMKLVGDEDAITELVMRAIKEALFQPKRTADRYGQETHQDSLVVATARKAAEAYADKLAQAATDELMADPENRKRIRNAIIDFLPAAIERSLASMLIKAGTYNTADTINSLIEMKQSGNSPL